MLPRKPLAKHKTRVKTHWDPKTPTTAHSILDQIERAILAGKPSDDPASPPFTTVKMPAHAANYMLNAIRMIRGGVDANAAFHLVADKRGQKKKSDRDTLIAIQIRERMRTHGESQEAASAKIGEQFNLSTPGAETARKNGREGADFFDQIRQFGGDDAGNDYIAHLTRKASGGEN